MAALRGDPASPGKLVFEERRLVRQGGDLGFLGRDSPFGCAFYGGVGVLEVGERFTEGGNVVQRVQRSASDFRYMNVRVVRQRREERRNW